MQRKFYMGLAGLTIEMNTRFEYVENFCRDYIIDNPEKMADIVASVTPERVQEEMCRVKEEIQEDVTEEYTETLALYRSIAEQLPKFGCFVFHGAAISFDGKGYLFTAPSCTGKTTHICLWRKFLGKRVDIINGDKPILRINDDGVSVCSTPWAGKENWHKNVIMPLAGACIINRGTDNLCIRQTPQEALRNVMHQVYLPKNTQSTGQTLENIDKLLKLVPFYRLTCDISENAVKASFEALTGQKF